MVYVLRSFIFNKMSKQRASLIAQLVKSLAAMQETWVRFLDWEDPVGKEMVTHSSILAWAIAWTEKPGRVTVPGVKTE